MWKRIAIKVGFEEVARGEMNLFINKCMYDKLLPFDDKRILFKAYISKYKNIEAFKGHTCETTLEQIYCLIGDKWYFLRGIGWWQSARSFFDYVGKTVLFYAQIKLDVTSIYNYHMHKEYLKSYIKVLYPSKVKICEID